MPIMTPVQLSSNITLRRTEVTFKCRVNLNREKKFLSLLFEFKNSILYGAFWRKASVLFHFMIDQSFRKRDIATAQPD